MFGSKPKPGEMKAAFAQLEKEIKHGTPEHDSRTAFGQWGLPKPPKRSRLDKRLGRHEQSVTRLTTNIAPKEDLATDYSGTRAANLHGAQGYEDH